MVTSKQNNKQDLKYKIRVKDKKALDGIVHGSVWRQGEFVFEPNDFVIESPRLENRIIAGSVQEKSLQTFIENPSSPMVYIVSGNPDDSKAKFFAAYLASLHKTKLGSKADIIWEPVYGGFDNPLLKKDIEPSMLILSNLAENSTNLKFEKVRDLIERWPSIPRIIVCAGEDPISFGASRLHISVHGIAYFGSKLSKTMQEVI